MLVDQRVIEHNIRILKNVEQRPVSACRSTMELPACKRLALKRGTTRISSHCFQEAELKWEELWWYNLLCSSLTVVKIVKYCVAVSRSTSRRAFETTMNECSSTRVGTMKSEPAINSKELFLCPSRFGDPFRSVFLLYPSGPVSEWASSRGDVFSADSSCPIGTQPGWWF